MWLVTPGNIKSASKRRSSCCVTSVPASIWASMYDKPLVGRNAARWLRKVDEHCYLDGIGSGGRPTA